LYYEDLHLPNVSVLEIYYAFPCETCFISEEYTAVKERIFTTLLKELLAKFLAWAKSTGLTAQTCCKWYG
jgi:hypothetical protein